MAAQSIGDAVAGLSAYCSNNRVIPQRVKLTHDVNQRSTQINGTLVARVPSPIEIKWDDQIKYNFSRILGKWSYAFKGPFLKKITLSTVVDALGVQTDQDVVELRFNVDQPKYRMEPFRVVLNQLRTLIRTEESGLIDAQATSFTLEFKGSRLRYLTMKWSKSEELRRGGFSQSYLESLESLITVLTGEPGSGYPTTKLKFDLSKRNSLKFCCGEVIPKQTLSLNSHKNVFKGTSRLIRDLSTILVNVPGARINTLSLVENVSEATRRYYKAKVSLLSVKEGDSEVPQTLFVSEASAKSLAVLLKEAVANYRYPEDTGFLMHLEVALHPVGPRWKAEYKERTLDVTTGLNNKSDILAALFKAQLFLKYEKTTYSLFWTVRDGFTKKLVYRPTGKITNYSQKPLNVENLLNQGRGYETTYRVEDEEQGQMIKQIEYSKLCEAGRDDNDVKYYSR